MRMREKQTSKLSIPTPQTPQCSMPTLIKFGCIFQEKEQSEEKMVRRFEHEEVIKPAKKAKAAPKKKALTEEEAAAAALEEVLAPLSAQQEEKAKKFMEVGTPKLAEITMLVEALEDPTMREYVASYKLTAAKKTTDKLTDLMQKHEKAKKEGARKTEWKVTAASASQHMKEVASTLKDLRVTSKEAQKAAAAGA